MKIKLTKESRVLLPEGTVVETSDQYAQILLSLRRAEIVTSEAPQLQSDEAYQPAKAKRSTTTKKSK